MKKKDVVEIGKSNIEKDKSQGAEPAYRKDNRMNPEIFLAFMLPTGELLLNGSGEGLRILEEKLQKKGLKIRTIFKSPCG